MRPLESLTFEAVVRRLRRQFQLIEQESDGNRCEYPLSDILMSGFAMFFLQDPSLLQFQERLERKKQRCNLQTMFGVRAVPKDSQMRERLDEVDPMRVRVLLPESFELVRRTGWAH